MSTQTAPSGRVVLPPSRASSPTCFPPHATRAASADAQATANGLRSGNQASRVRTMARARYKARASLWGAKIGEIPVGGWLSRHELAHPTRRRGRGLRLADLGAL